MSAETPTPLTDAYCAKREEDGDHAHPEWREFARQLERRCAELERERETLKAKLYIFEKGGK